MVILNNVTVKYGQNTVYKDFSFRFDSGVNVVLGKSGCGKTTLINIIADLVDYTGTCQKDGDVAIVFQQPCLAPISVWKNVDAVLPRGNNRAAIEEILSAVQLSDKKNAPALTLSGGEQQRVSLARAFVTGRQTVLLDEPFSNLDYGVKLQLGRIFDNLLKEDKTVLFVTHDIDEALALADKIYLLHDSPCALTEIAQISTPRALRDEYSDETLVQKQKLQQLLQ